MPLTNIVIKNPDVSMQIRAYKSFNLAMCHRFLNDRRLNPLKLHLLICVQFDMILKFFRYYRLFLETLLSYY